MNGVSAAAAVGMIATLACGVRDVTAQEAGQFEAPPVMLAIEALPPEMVVGPDHRVEDFVYNDGAINRYQVTSTFGRASVRSTALLALRIDEVRALRHLEQLASTEAYVAARQAAQSGPLRAQKRLIVGSPSEGTGPSNGVGTFFGVPADVTGAPAGGDLTETATRFDAYRRAFAYAAGLNPYSRFEAVQVNLREFAWNCFAGGLSVDEAFASIADAPVQLRPPTKFEDRVYRRIRDESPATLRERNVQLLVGMGVDEGLARVLQSQSRFTPVAKTVITEALVGMDGVADRQVFVERAALIEATDMAHLIQVWSELLAGYHDNVEPVSAMVRLGSVPFLRTKSGKVVGVFAMDLLVWTPQTASAVDRIGAALGRLDGVSGRELWFAGRVTPLTRRNLEQRGWTVVQQAGDRLRPG